MKADSKTFNEVLEILREIPDAKWFEESLPERGLALASDGPVKVGFSMDPCQGEVFSLEIVFDSGESKKKCRVEVARRLFRDTESVLYNYLEALAARIRDDFRRRVEEEGSESLQGALAWARTKKS